MSHATRPPRPPHTSRGREGASEKRHSALSRGGAPNALSRGGAPNALSLGGRYKTNTLEQLLRVKYGVKLEELAANGCAPPPPQPPRLQ